MTGNEHQMENSSVCALARLQFLINHKCVFCPPVGWLVSQEWPWALAVDRATAPCPAPVLSSPSSQ